MTNRIPDQIEQESSVRKRVDGLVNLRHVLRHNQNSSSVNLLADASFHRIFEVLFQFAVSDQSTWLKSRATVTKTAAETRLSDCASTLRLAVEVGVQALQLKTVKAVIDHVIQTLPLPNGGLCMPLALEYAKCLRTVLAHQPHVEHLMKKDWERVAAFCVAGVKNSRVDYDEDTAMSGADISTAGTINNMSYRSSRSHYQEFENTQSARSLVKQVTEEMVPCLSLLTAAPNAPLGDQAAVVLWTLVDFLKTNPVSGRSHEDAFTAVNHILRWTRTEDITLTQTAASHLVRLVRHFWPQKTASLKDEMLILLLLLQSYIPHCARQREGVAFRSELSGLLEVMRTEYGKRLERDVLQLEDLRLSFGRPFRHGEVVTPTFKLRCDGSRAEHGWAFFSVLSLLSRTLSESTDAEGLSDDDDQAIAHTRPRKRQRRRNDFEETLASTASGSVCSRVCALQTIAFMSQKKPLSIEQIATSVDQVSSVCNEDNGTITSWALLALAGLVSQAASTDSTLSDRWSAVWQLAARLMSNMSMCRAACHLLQVMMHLHLASQACVADLLSITTHAMDANGPAIVADSVLSLLVSSIEASHQISPATTIAIAESTLSWLFRKFQPSRFDDKSYASIYYQFSAEDVKRLIEACLNQRGLPQLTELIPLWGPVAQAWIFQEEQTRLVSFLLLLPEKGAIVNRSLNDEPLTENTIAAPRTTCETLLLNNLTSELDRTVSTWKQWEHERPHNLSVDMFKSVCQSCCIMSSIVYDFAFRDLRRQTQMRNQLADLLASLQRFISGPSCGQDQIDVMLQYLSPALPGLHADHSQPRVSECEKVISRFIFDTMALLQQKRDFDPLGEDEDLMDMGDRYDSQDSRRDKATAQSHYLKNDGATAFSALALRANVTLYAAVVTTLADEDSSLRSQQGSASARVTSYILSLPETTILAGRASLAMLPKFGLLLDAADADRLLSFCSEAILPSYTYERSEVAVGAILDLMSSLAPVWTARTNQSLYGLGLDMYDWYTTTALSGGVLSPNLQRRAASLLLQLCHIDTDYGREDNVRSVRTSLFKLLELGSISVKYHLANRISTIFGLYVLPNHMGMFDDLRMSLPEDVEWVEGLAMRLLFFAQLASAWHSLLRPCVYYIFETAGQLKPSTQYAAHCIGELALSLKFANPQRLFRLFAPQLLHSWLEHQTVASLPFAAFQYSSLNELLEQNLVETTAQLLMRGNDEGIQLLAATLRTSPRSLAQRSFAKCVAYAISWDISQPGSDPSNVTSEARLRSLMDTKEDYRSMVAAHFPAIMGHFYLTTEQDDQQDKWLNKKTAYTSACTALEETKTYSYSTRPLPPSQQPYFKSKYLCDQIERLCRRTTHDPLKPWDVSSFALAARMLVDAIHHALGPLHTCLMLRRLRTLICMAGDVATTDFPLEMLLQSVRPFLNDSECADDALGIIQYLLHRGQTYLQSKHSSFTSGTILVMVLQMRQHATAKHDSTTQESQYRTTVQKMEAFQSWLVKYLQQGQTANAQLLASHNTLVEALGQVRLPGNGQKGSAEGALLVLLLEPHDSDETLLLPSHCMEAMSLLTQGFEVPSTVAEDCLGEDHACVRYADRLWTIIQTSRFDDDFLLWASGVLGKAYALTGTRPQMHPKSTSGRLQDTAKVHDGVVRSQTIIAQRLADLLLSQDREEAGLADYTLRRIQQTFKDAEDAISFEQMLPDTVVAAVAEGTFDYEPMEAAGLTQTTTTRPELQQACEPSHAIADDEWYRHLAACLCRWASQTCVLPALPAILRHVPGLAADLLPSLIHIVLYAEHDKQTILRAELSKSMAMHFADHDPKLRSRQRFLLEVLLYLRSQPLPGEKTKADRIRWLDVDYLLAADAAARCGMPACALSFAESATSTAQTTRRKSSRVSMSQLGSAQVPEELLLSIFKQIEEPDSFYGVQQPATLDLVLDRLDYERDGLKSLMFRSAHMDAAMRLAHPSKTSNSAGMARSLSALNLYSVSYALLSKTVDGTVDSADQVTNAAKRLQQWDIAPPERSSGEATRTFAFFQELSRATDRATVKEKLRSTMLQHVSECTALNVERPSMAWCSNLASFTEIGHVLDASSDSQFHASWLTLQARQDWMRMVRFEDCYEIQSNRQTLFGVLAQNKTLLTTMHVGYKMCRFIEAESLLSTSRFTRKHGVLQEALSSITQVTALQDECSELGINIKTATSLETASVLWDVGETAASVKILRDMVNTIDIEEEDISVGRPGLLAQLAYQLADARLEKPDDILADYLKPAIERLGARNEGQEAGQVFHEFASFCERQLHNSGNVEDFDRITKIRQKKLEEVEGLEAIAKNPKRVGTDRAGINSSLHKARQWFTIDDAEYQRIKQSRDTYTELSLQNYLLTLHASDEHNICVLRFFALWLDNYEMPSANQAAGRHLPSVPAWKFVLLNNQLMSRLEDDKSAFQDSMKALAQRICAEHPHHSLYHLYAVTRKPLSKDPAAWSRYQAATNIRTSLQSDARVGDILKRIFAANGSYNLLAQAEVSKQNAKLALKDVPYASRMQETVQKVKVPPATISLPLRPDGDYSDVPVVLKYSSAISIMTGLSAPKALVAYASDGQQYKQLFKGGNDDLRQDAIMEQVFEEVSKMLRNHKATRQRNLHVRTYKVIPLTTRSGIIEFVPNSIPINDFLVPAHQRYYPGSWKPSVAREKISAVKEYAKETRLKEFRKVCEHIPPVLRHFFLERFDDPDEWFEKRTNYTRTTATVSILGYVLGLGDRHCHNILLDEKSGEVVHIDLGVAFEAGRVLPIPELVPFRLTRDIVDGMGTTKTEGVFRRCCEFTMDALREDKDSILTLLNVLRYDPLYNWTLSPLRAKKMQDAEDLRRDAAEEASSKRKEHEAGEADRALSIVEKKLSKTLSTAATVNELIQQATDEMNLATLFSGWSAYY